MHRAAPEAASPVPTRPTRFRRVRAEAVAAFARLAVRIFFKDVDVTGLDNLPSKAPLVMVANHNNSVVDSFLLLALPKARPRMLAKSTLFSHAVMGPLLFVAGALPVYRRLDEGADVTRNSDTFSRCHALLAAGGSIALFPEGMSHNLERQPPLKTGAARILLGAEALRGPLGVRVVPVGLFYDAKERFRSRVSIHVGPCLDATTELNAYNARQGDAIRALTARIALALEGAVGQAKEKSETRRLVADAPPLGPVVRLLALPILLLGYTLNWLPYRLPGWIAGRLSQSPDDRATYKLLAGILAFPLVWAGEALLAARLGGWAWGAATAVAAPVSGYVALRLREMRSPT